MNYGLVAAALFLLSVPMVSAGPEQVHVSPTADGRSLVVQWASSVPLAPNEAVVQWAPDEGAFTTTVAELVGRTTGISDAPSMTFHYAATLGPFPPATTLTYQVGAGSDLTLPMRIATTPSDSLRLVAYGDVGSDSLGAAGAAPDLEGPQFLIQNQIFQARPDLQLILGDLAYESSNGGWDRFMRFMERTAGTIPTLSATGNHEWLNDVDRYDQFLQRFVLPGDEQNFVAFAGPVRLIVLNSDLVCLSKAPQNVLPAEAPCARGQPNPVALGLLQGLPEFAGWTIAAFHHPVWSSGTHGSNPEVVALWRPLLEAAGVDLVLTAHDHLYERTHQMDGDTIVDLDGAFERGNGTVYVVAGGGGRELYEFEPEQPAWSAARSVSHHILVIDATPEGLHVRAIDVNGKTIDEFTIGAVAVDEEDDGGPNSADLPALPIVPVLGLLAIAVAWRRRHL